MSKRKEYIPIQRGIAALIVVSNRRRPHTARAGRTPDAVCRQHRPLEQPDLRTTAVA